MNKSEKLEIFEKWCKENVATFEPFEDGGYMEERNVSWDELSFYDELVAKVKSLL